MAFTRQEKEQIVDQYREWIDKSKAVYYLSYNKMTMPVINDARAKLRESESEMHVVKNRLFTRVWKKKVILLTPPKPGKVIRLLCSRSKTLPGLLKP